MSKSQSRDHPGARRGNWWGDEMKDDQDDQEPDVDASEYGTGDDSVNNPGVAGVWKPDPNDVNEIIAHRLFRDTVRMLCSETLFTTPALEGGLVERSTDSSLNQHRSGVTTNTAAHGHFPTIRFLFQIPSTEHVIDGARWRSIGKKVGTERFELPVD